MMWVDGRRFDVYFLFYLPTFAAGLGDEAVERVAVLEESPEERHGPCPHDKNRGHFVGVDEVPGVGGWVGGWVGGLGEDAYV